MLYCVFVLKDTVLLILNIFFFSFKVAAQDTQTSLLNTVVQQEMAVRRQRVGISRQDSRLSVKSLIESIEKSQQQVRSLFSLKLAISSFLTINFISKNQILNFVSLISNLNFISLNLP